MLNRCKTVGIKFSILITTSPAHIHQSKNHSHVYVFICLCIHLVFFQVDFWQPDSVTLVRPKMQVDFRVEAEKSFEVEDLLKESRMEYQ